MRTTATVSILLMGCAACGSRPRPASAPAPLPGPPAAPAPAAQPVPSNPEPRVVVDELHACGLRDGELVEILVHYRTRLGDTVYQGLPLSHTFPLTGEYASVAGWYVHNEPITVRGVRWVKYGLPRGLGIREITRVDEHRGVGVYVEAGQTVPADVIYLPTRPGCEFQPYVRSAKM